MSESASREHRTVSRVTGILEYVAQHENGVRMADIVAHLDAPRSSIHGLVHGLVSNGYLRMHDAGLFVIGPAVNALHPPRSSIERSARAAMVTLHEEFDETVTLVMLSGESVVYTEAIESTRAIRYTPPIGVRRPLYPTSAGKCFLANSSEDFRERYLVSAFSDTATRNRVRGELASIADRGVALNEGDTLPDLHAVSAPVFSRGAVAAVITVAGPSTRMVDHMKSIIAAVKTATQLASSRR
ncbi:IclR family transcriptional regulator [Rhodococcus sp. NPDC057297]|uniref:IclR family transcriptional regulator n=1 Tax=Rhodococcus sp. NPDC057297 TaxID=3346090 RepID=UPI00363F6535